VLTLAQCIVDPAVCFLPLCRTSQTPTVPAYTSGAAVSFFLKRNPIYFSRQGLTSRKIVFVILQTENFLRNPSKTENGRLYVANQEKPY